MDYNIQEVANRLKGLREAADISQEEMANRTGTPLEAYQKIEAGEQDFSVTLLYKCADICGVDLIELLTGEPPRLQKFTVVRKGQGLPVRRRAGFHYQHLAYLFKDKLMEPVLVEAPYPDEQQNPIRISTHAGQEMELVLEGDLRLIVDGREVILHEGDCAYFDASLPHGMVAEGKNCKFLAVLVKRPETEQEAGGSL